MYRSIVVDIRERKSNVSTFILRDKRLCPLVNLERAKQRGWETRDATTKAVIGP